GSRVCTEAEAAGPGLETRPEPPWETVEPIADAVEVRVAGRGERGPQIHPGVRRGIPVVERVPGDRVGAGALQVFERRDDALLHRGERRHGLPRRSRRI